MNIHAGYFEIPTFSTLLRGLDRLLHPYRHLATVQLRDHPTVIRCTRRAERALSERQSPLIAEMQLYFSCVVKKRVLFHDTMSGPSVTVNDRLAIQFRPVEASACDPEAFARGYPVRREYHSAAAANFKPSLLELDIVDGAWQGNFYLGSRAGRA